MSTPMAIGSPDLGLLEPSEVPDADEEDEDEDEDDDHDGFRSRGNDATRETSTTCARRQGTSRLNERAPVGIMSQVTVKPHHALQAARCCSAGGRPF